MFSLLLKELILDFYFPDLSCMICNCPASLLSGPWLTGILSSCYSVCFHYLTLTLCRGQFCHLHLCPDLSFGIAIIFGFFKVSFFFSSGLLFCYKDQGSQGLPLSPLFAKKLMINRCVNYRLVEVNDHGVQSSFFIFQRGKRCKSAICCSSLESNHCRIIQLLKVKPDSWLGWISWFLRCLESYHHNSWHGRFQHLHMRTFEFCQFYM